MKFDLYSHLSFSTGYCSICHKCFDSSCHGCINLPDDIDVIHLNKKISDHEFKLVNHIKEYRDNYDITQDDLADLTGLTQTTISSYENYLYYPTLFNALLLSSVFGCSLDDLFEFKIS